VGGDGGGRGREAGSYTAGEPRVSDLTAREVASASAGRTVRIPSDPFAWLDPKPRIRITGFVKY
jgi:hypothetical protein